MGTYDYTGKTVYIGIDVHKKTYACACICEWEIIKRDTMTADSLALTQYIKNQFKGAVVETVYEAGFSGFHLHRQLIQAGINNIIVHPGSIEIASRDRVKNDKRDAIKLAVQLAARRLKCIYIPTLEQESKRCASRLRDNIVKQRQQVGLKIKALLFTQGLIIAEDDTVLGKQWLNKKLEQVKNLKYPDGFYYALKRYADQWLGLTSNLNEIKKEIISMQTQEELSLLKIYQSAPGVGVITALKLKDELGDMKQFSNEKQLFNYLGFTPVEYSSGEHTRQGHISRQGRAKLRHLFIELAWIAIRKDDELCAVYQRLTKKRGGKKAIVAVARRLAGRLRSCVQKNIEYKIKNQSLQIESVNVEMSCA